MEKEIGISTASKLLGISISTLKRLCDDNLIPSIRTPGGHRRFDRAEVELVGQRLVGSSMRLTESCDANLKDKIAFLLLTGNEGGLDELTKAQLAAGLTLTSLLDQCFVPAFAALEAAGDVTPTLIQLAQQLAVRVINRLCQPLHTNTQVARKWSTTPRAIGGAVGHGWDDVLSKFLEATLRSVSSNAMHMESQVDIAQLANTAKDLNLRAVWLAQWQEQASTELIELGRELSAMLPVNTKLLLFAGGRSAADAAPAELPTYRTFQLFLRDCSELLS